MNIFLYRRNHVAVDQLQQDELSTTAIHTHHIQLSAHTHIQQLAHTPVHTHTHHPTQHTRHHYTTIHPIIAHTHIHHTHHTHTTKVTHSENR